MCFATCYFLLIEGKFEGVIFTPSLMNACAKYRSPNLCSLCELARLPVPFACYILMANGQLTKLAMIVHIVYIDGSYIDDQELWGKVILFGP